MGITQSNARKVNYVENINNNVTSTMTRHSSYIRCYTRTLIMALPRWPYAKYAMGDQVCPYKVLDVAQLLQARYAFISGGKDKSGCPVLTFPDNPHLGEVADEEYKKVITYLVNVPALFDADLGFAIVIDRRKEGWSSVKAVLHKISTFFPGKIQIVFVLKPTGFLARAFSDWRSKFKDDFSFKVVVCATPTELHEYIDPGQLTLDVGGYVVYDHNEWIQDRSAIEKFESNTSKIAQVLHKLSTRYEEIELPNNVEGTEALMKDTFLERKEMLEDLTSATHHGGTILACIKGDNPHTPLVKVVHVVALERLLVQLEETQKSFDTFWNQHEEKLRQCLQQRKFEEKFKILQYGVERHVEWLETRLSDSGQSLHSVATLIQQLDKFEEESKTDIEKAERLQSQGEQLILEDHYAVDCIRPKCIELQRMCDQYKQLLRRRREILERSHDLHDRIERANKWCTRGVDLLAMQQIERFQTQEGAEQALSDIENFMVTSAELKLSNPKEFRALFESMITPETKAVVQSVLKRIEDVSDMCDKRKNSLQRMTSRQRPVQPVTPDLRAPPKSPTATPEGDLKSKKASELNGSKKNIYEKSARLRVDIQHPSHLGDPSPSSDVSSSRSHSASSLNDLDTLIAKRRHVMNELIDTEKTYVTELDDILRGYYYEVENPNMKIPPVLKGRRDVLFGNLNQIYCFHNDTFIQDLEDCKETPGLVGKCFMHRREEFQMYSTYCQNKPQAEALRMEVGDNHPFFKECQRRLGHKLPLGAYLLKPVQRITKYQLLLKEMLKYMEDDVECQAELREALNTMLGLLKYVNDLMHQVAIKGFPGQLADQGRLLMQGSFNVWTEHKKDKIKNLRFKPRHRHIFLYEKSIMLCKKREDVQHADRAVYSFKNLLKTAQVGLTENVKGDKKKFELWLPGSEEVYTIQAPNMTVKEEWVKEVKKVLLNQFDQIKVRRRSYQLISEDDLMKDPVVKATEVSMDSGFTESSWKSSQVNNNFGSSQRIGQEMIISSPLEPHDDDPGWSSGEFSNSEEEVWHQDTGVPQEGGSEHGYFEPAYLQQFSSLAEYMSMDPGELSLKEGDVVEILRVGTEGWWYAQNPITHQEGWVPASYLEPVPKRSSRSTLSTSSLERVVAEHHCDTPPYREELYVGENGRYLPKIPGRKVPAETA